MTWESQAGALSSLPSAALNPPMQAPTEGVEVLWFGVREERGVGVRAMEFVTPWEKRCSRSILPGTSSGLLLPWCGWRTFLP